MDMIERVARALFQRDVEEDVCDGTWEDNVALHDRILADARAAIEAMRDPTDEQRSAFYELSHETETMFDAHWERAIDAALRD